VYAGTSGRGCGKPLESGGERTFVVARVGWVHFGQAAIEKDSAQQRLQTINVRWRGSESVCRWKAVCDLGVSLWQGSYSSETFQRRKRNELGSQSCLGRQT